MKIGNLKPAINTKPFIVAPKFSIITTELDGHIVSFDVSVPANGKKTFKVANHNILAAWKKVEQYCEKVAGTK